MAKKESTGLVKEGWISNFNLVGIAKRNDFTFKINQKSDKSDWIYNSLNLGIDCGEHCGVVYCELMNGYGSERDNVVYLPDKKEDGSADFKNSYTIAWEDRFNEDILKDVPDMMFIKVGLEKTDQEKTFVQKFLTGYDAIAYIEKYLEDGMVVNVKGQLKYTVYNGVVQCRKEVNSIFLSKATPDQYKAVFTQTVLLDQDSCTKKSLDKDKSVLMVEAYVLEKFKEYNGYDLTDNGKIKGGQLVPLRRTFEYPVDLTTDKGKEKVTKVLNSDKMFKVKKGTVTQITFEGEFVESGATVQVTMDDVPDDIKELIDIGVYTEEEALARCADNSTHERKMIILKPHTKKVGDDDNKITIIDLTTEKFVEEDLLLDCLVAKEDDEEVDEEDALPFEEDEVEETEEETADDDDWLNSL